MRTDAMLLLGIAIVCELVATTCLKVTGAGERPVWYVPVVLGYGAAFYVFSIVVQAMPLGVAYAVWAGVGIAGSAVIGWILFDQHLPPITLLGICLILAGTLLVNLSSSGT